MTVTTKALMEAFDKANHLDDRVFAGLWLENHLDDPEYEKWKMAWEGLRMAAEQAHQSFLAELATYKAANSADGDGADSDTSSPALRGDGMDRERGG